MKLIDRWTARFDRAFGYAKPEPPRLGCGCFRGENVIIACLECGHERCERHRSDPHDCVKESADV